MINDNLMIIEMIMNSPNDLCIEISFNQIECLIIIHS